MAGEAREYKDRLFCYIFGSEAHKDWTLSLYNAVNGSSYTDPSAITIADEINLYEQQSTYNPNMPLRLLQYTGNIYEKLVMLRRENKFGKRLIRLPVPKLVVFYNGTTDMPDETELRLSDAFPEEKRAEADITVRVRMVNINAGRSPGVVASCKPLDEYAWLVARIRRNEREADPAAAIDAALDAMPESFLIKRYLDANRVEVKKMLLTEYNETQTMELFKEEEGETKLGILINKLMAAGRISDIEKAATDPASRDRLYTEFGMA